MASLGGSRVGGLNRQKSQSAQSSFNQLSSRNHASIAGAKPLKSASQIRASLAKGAPLRNARAKLRAKLATQMKLPVAHRNVIREANAQLRIARKMAAARGGAAGGSGGASD